MRQGYRPQEGLRWTLGPVGALLSLGAVLLAGCTRGVTYIPQASAASGREVVASTYPSGLPTAAVSPSETRTDGLTPGSMGEAVTVLQSRLSKIGCLVTVNGLFDAKTLDAMQKFEANKKLPITTVLDSTTRTALNASVEAGDKNCGLPPVLKEILGRDLPFCGPPLAPTTPCIPRPTASTSPTTGGGDIMKYFTK